MLVPMSDNLKLSMRVLMRDQSFKDFLKWLEDSREKTHQKMYTTLEPASLNYLQGSAKEIFDVVTECYRALVQPEESAFPRLSETPGGDV